MDQMFRNIGKSEKSVSLATPPPISQLPTELLMDIFSCCVESDTSLPVHPGDRKRDSKIDLSHVCSRWRDIVLSMHDLWTAFSIREPKTHKSLLMRVLDRHAASLRDSLQSWIGRSGHLPIQLFLDNISRSTTLDVMPHVHRCKLLSLKVNHLTIPNMLALFSETLSHLQEFRFGSSIYGDVPLDIVGTSALHNPLHWHNLSRLVWTGRETSFSLVGVEMPNLTDISIESSHLPIDQCVRFLSGCPKLQRVHLCRVSIDDRPRIPIPHPRIELLHIKCYDDDPCLLLRYFDLPSLNDLHLSSRRLGWTQPAYQSFADFAARSSCHLKSF
ncbi:hypothetical protein FPV67DRAFT_158009 [Lyophyllum atratum]|nr:hypothetical protein FPV67DRAFT_158009 [Lyophyllum atratum]